MRDVPAAEGRALTGMLERIGIDKLHFVGGEAKRVPHEFPLFGVVPTFLNPSAAVWVDFVNLEHLTNHRLDLLEFIGGK